MRDVVIAMVARSHLPLDGDVLGRAAHVHELVATLPGLGDLPRTSLGGSRIVDMLVGDPLPRIC